MYYPIKSLRSSLHVTGLGFKRTLCGITPPRYWESEFEGQAFPEVGEFVEKHPATQGEGFYIGRWFAGAYQFCPKCYELLKLNLKHADPLPAQV